MLSVRESLKKVLEQTGYRTLLAADGQGAVDHFKTGQVDLMLLDIGLPIQSGWEAFERITLANPLLPVIIITGQADQFHAAKAAGVGAFMEKPLDVERLLATIEDLLAESRETRLRRMCGLDEDVRHIPSHSALFLQHLRERLEAPYRSTLNDLTRIHHSNPGDDD